MIPTKEEQFLDTIRQIILETEREEHQRVRQDVELIKAEFLQKERFYSHLEPYFGEKIDDLRKRFPELFGPFITTAIKMQIRDSQDEVIDAMYPIMGKLVRKYIATEIEELGKKIDEQIQRAFSPEAWWERIKSFISGETYREPSVVTNALKPTLEEIFIIANDSGLLLGQYSFNNLIDADMIAGMLTGIKSFVEHAFMKGPQEIQALEYDNYKIVVNSFPHYYMAFVVQGVLTHDLRSRILDASLDFSDKHKINLHEGNFTRAMTDELSGQLDGYFRDFNKGYEGI